MSRISESATLQVARRADELRRQGVDVLDLGPGEPDFDSPAVAVEAARRGLAEGFTRYTQAAGIPELRQALAASYRERYDAPFEMPNTVVTVGAKAALYLTAFALLDRGDEVVLPSPAWVSFEEQIRFAGGEPVTVPMSADDGFEIHPEPLLEAVTDRTRAVLVNSPSNPTGGMISAEGMATLARGCAERGILLISDETYERFVYGERRHAGAAAHARELPDTVVVVSSFSKTYAMTGWRLGYLLGPAKLVKGIAEIQSHATSNPTSFAMLGALAALEGAEDDVVAMIDEYAARRELLIPLLNELPGFRCSPPQGAFYAFPHVAEAFPAGIEGSVAFAQHLLDEAAVAVVPGAAFGADDHVRLSFACSRETLEQAVERIAGVLAGPSRRPG
jgi:aspartate aminotransferase